MFTREEMCKKRSIGVILGTILLVAVICSGCGEKEEAGYITIRWIADPNPIRKEQIAIFEKENPGIKVNPDWVSTGVVEKVLTQIAGGNAPDIFMVYHIEKFIALVKKDVLEDLAPYCAKSGLDLKDFWPQIGQWIYYQDKAYGLPEAVSPEVLFYNKKMFKEANVPYPTNEWTWKDFLSAAQKLTKKDSSGRFVQFGFTPSTGMIGKFPLILIWQNGGSVYSPDGKKCVVNSPEAIEALQFDYDLRFKHHVMPTSLELDNFGAGTGVFGNAPDMFATGKIAMYIEERCNTITFRKYKDLEYGVAHIPHGKGKVTFLGLHTNVIPKGAENKEAAFKFLKSLVSKEGELLVANYGEGIPSRKSIAETKEFLFNPAYPKELDNRVYLEAMSYAHDTELSPYISPLETFRIWDEEMKRMWAKQQTPEETLQSIQRKIQGIINGGE